MMRISGLLCALILTGWLAPACATPLVVGVEQDSPPKWQNTRSKPPTGFCADLFQAMSRRDPGLQFAFSRPLPQKRIEMGMTDGELDLICGLTRTVEREQRFHVIAKPIYAMDYVLIARADDPVEIPNWEAVRALGSQGVILLNYDSGAVSRLKRLEGLTLDHTGRDIETNLKKLANGRGRFFYYTVIGATTEIRRLGLGPQFRQLAPPLETLSFHLLTGKHVPAPQRRRLQTAVTGLEQSGELYRLQQQWGI